MPLAVLVVDDSPTVRAALIRELPDGQGLRVEQAENGEQALEACARAMPDVMFLDLAMPLFDGYGVLRRLGATQRRPKIVVVSTDVTDDGRASLISLGADEVVSKPWRAGEIERALRRIGAV